MKNKDYQLTEKSIKQAIAFLYYELPESVAKDVNKKFDNYSTVMVDKVSQLENERKILISVLEDIHLDMLKTININNENIKNNPFDNIEANIAVNNKLRIYLNKILTVVNPKTI